MRAAMSIPVFAARHVYAAVDPSDAVEAVREAFVAHARGEWLMPSKVYVPAPPDGDFRAMPARGGGYAVLKWVTSFPRNPERGLPDRRRHRPPLRRDRRPAPGRARRGRAHRAAHRRGGRARRGDAGRGRRARRRRSAAASTGARSRGRSWPAAARSSSGTRTPSRTAQVAGELGARRRPAPARRRSAADVVATVTPGREILFGPGSLRAGPARQPHGRGRAGQGGDRRRGAGARPRRRRRVGAGEPQRRHLARRRGAATLRRDDVTELGRILLGEAAGPDGRRRDHRLRLDRPRRPGPRRGDRLVYEQLRTSRTRLRDVLEIDLGES